MEELMALMKKGGGSGDNPIGKNEVLKYVATSRQTPYIGTYALNENIITSDLYFSGGPSVYMIINCQGHTLADIKTYANSDDVFGFNDSSIVRILLNSTSEVLNYDISQFDYIFFRFASSAAIQDRYIVIKD